MAAGHRGQRVPQPGQGVAPPPGGPGQDPAAARGADELAGRLDDAAQLHLVAEALGALRRSEREVMALCVWSGLDYTAAAGALGVPVGTVRSRLSRARRRLRKLVPPDREPAGGREQIPGDRANAARPSWEK